MSEPMKVTIPKFENFEEAMRRVAEQRSGESVVVSSSPPKLAPPLKLFRRSVLMTPGHVETSASSLGLLGFFHLAGQK